MLVDLVQLAALVQFITPFVLGVLIVLAARRVGRFLNIVEARAISIDEHLARLDRAPSPKVAKRREHAGQLEVSDRDRALLELAAEHDRDQRSVT